MTDITLLQTPLHDLHVELGARMVEFAGYAMPVSYPGGIIAEHRHCRAAAALFDVSHMGQLRLVGDGAAAALETLAPMDFIDLGMDRQRYACFTNTAGGIIDDLMVTRRHGDLMLVVNAACKDADARYLMTQIGDACAIVPMADRALLALQGPQAATALARIEPLIEELVFLTGGEFDLDGAPCYVTRSGYTGEDGFEISVPNEHAVKLAKALLAMDEVEPAGLGARDTLRLEAGLCLYGHDIGPTTSPVEAGLTWAMPKVRRPGGARAGRYVGASVIESHLDGRAPSKRVGLVGLERVPVREGAIVHDAHGHRLGVITSGTTAPSIGKPIAMAYLPIDHARPQHEVYADVRGKAQPMRVTPMPFHPHRYYRG